MYHPGSDEKTSAVMFYSQNAFVRGDVVTKGNVRVSIWLRTQGVPNYLHLLKAQVLLFGGTPPKSITYDELYFPTTQIIAFHLAPPLADPLDYDPKEANRTMVEVSFLIGTFTIKGKLRISTQTDFATSIEVGRASWLSIYDADITNPFLAQMPPIHVPMLLIRPEHVSFGL
ncbi:MAG TPA: hypothetical protein VLX61_11305 [Anaerolineales bacterium]|nr:hypothetical protein [Anaerolineales bacterium]